MKKLYKYLIVIALVCSSFVSKAQNDGIGFTLLPQIPYGNYYNPGIRVDNRGMVGVAFSNINFSMYNSSVKYSNLYGSDKSVIDAVKFVNSLKNDNVINTNFSLDLVNVGFRVKNLFFNIDWRMRMTGQFNYSQDFVGLFVLGNAHYMGANNPCDFGLGMDLSLYHEWGISAQYNVNDKLTVGIRPKVLSGIANATVENKQTKIYTDPTTYAITADVDLNIHMASLLEGNVQKMEDVGKMIDSVTSKDLLDFGENIGFGVDFGASYKIDEHFGVAAGVYDLGYIKWTDAKVKRVEKSNVTLNDALFNDYSQLTTFEIDYKSMVQDVIDEVWGNEVLENGADYKTYLKTRLMIQGYYELNPMVRATAIGQLYFDKGKVHPALTIAYSGCFWNHLNLTVNCTMSKYTGTGMGIGIGGHFGPFNIYAVTDNFLNVTKIGAPALELASSFRQANARFGIVWSW